MKSKLHQYQTLLILIIISIFILVIYFNRILYILGVFELLAIIISLKVVFFSQREASSKFAWILLLLFFPLFGMVLYFLLGKEPKHRKFPKQQIENERLLQHYVADMVRNHPGIIYQGHVLSKEIYHLSSKFPTTSNELMILSEGDQAYNQLLKDIQLAKDHIHVFFFIIKGDEAGIKLTKELINKAIQGIKVRFMYDSLGSIAFPNQLLKKMRSYGIEVRTYDLLNSPWLSNKANWRNHRKMVIIDGKIAHVGGMNIGDEYRGKGKKFTYWRDTNVRLSGPSVTEVQECFMYDWIFLDKSKNALDQFFENKNQYFPIFDLKKGGYEIVQVVYGGPYDEERIIKDSFIDLIGKATRSIKIATPYFIPNEEILGGLRRASRSGIKVQIIIPGKGDRGISYYGTNSFIDTLLTAGIEVYAYNRSSFIHYKCMVIDDSIATIGSTNFDRRSFFLNHELSLFIYGPSSAVNILNSQFINDLKNSQRIEVFSRKKRPLSEKAKEKICALFIPIL